MKTLRKKYLWILLPVTLFIAWWFCLPDPLFEASYSTVLLDRNGQLLGARLADDGQWRFPGDDLEVPETFTQSIITFEDKRFYRHSGVDFLALGRAIRDNFKSGQVVSGGSTLTMQTLRLARNKGRRNVWQKLVEIIWAWRAEVRYSKKDILRLYAAHAPFGGNVVGLGAASWRYYQKAPSELSWGEAATLAVLPNAPGLIHPGRNRELLRSKRDNLIRRLAETGTIDETEASLAMLEPLPDAPHPLPDLAPHLLGRYKNVRETLHSTIDAGWQQRLSGLLHRHAELLSLNGVYNAALLVMETESGHVLAYMGNTEDQDKRHHNDVDIIRSERSSGSILKPFLYCAALEDGLITPDGLVEDIPTYIRGYQPLNFTRQYMGMVPANQALAMSLNVPAVRLLQQYGLLPFKEKLIKAGITTLRFSPEHYGLPLVLGGAEVTLWDICGSYASMGRILSHAYPYHHRYDPEDIHPPKLWLPEDTKRREPKLIEKAPVWHAGAIWHTFEAMTSLRRPDHEGQWEVFSSSRKIAWKTGTSFGYRDAWAVGVTPGYTIGVWVGNADGEGRPGVIGLNAAAPIMFDVLRMLDDQPSWWQPPYDELSPKVICRESGWPASTQCTSTDTVFLPKIHQTPPACQFHSAVYTDTTGRFRYDPSCLPEKSIFRNYFSVPPIAESFYKRYNPSYEIIPPLHPDCQLPNSTGAELAIIYPRTGSRIYVPYEWDKSKSKAVFTAVHRSDTAQVYWHLDKKFIGKTREFHRIEVDPTPGYHTLVLQDESGAIASVTFEVL